MADGFTSKVTPGPERFAVMSIDEQILLIPQHELVSLEPVQDLKQFPRGTKRAVGQVTFGQEQIPVYCLTPQLEISTEVPPQRRVCTLLQSPQHGVFGLLCDQVSTLHSEATNAQPLPECMRMPGTPIQSLILQDERVLCTSSSSHLAMLISSCAISEANSEHKDS